MLSPLRAGPSLSVLALLAAGCFLITDFEDKPAGTGSGGGASVSGTGTGAGSGTADTTGGTASSTGVGGGGGGDLTCPTPGAVAAVLTGPSVELRAMATDGQKVWLAGVWNGEGDIDYRAQPGAGCAAQIKQTDELVSTFLVQIDIASLALDWWTHVATRVGANAADVDIAVLDDKLYVGGTMAIGSSLLGVMQAQEGVGWAVINRNEIVIDADRRAIFPGSPTVCTGGPVSELDIAPAALGASIVLSVPATTMLACDGLCAGTSPEMARDAYLLHMDTNGACIGGPHLIDGAHDEDDVQLARLSDVNVLYGWRTFDDRKGRFGYLVTTLPMAPPAFSPMPAEFSETIGDNTVGRSEVRVATAADRAIAGTTLYKSGHHYLEVRDSASGGAFQAGLTTAATLDVYLGDATLDENATALFGGAIDEAVSATAVFGGTIAPDQPSTPCGLVAPARNCGDVYWVELDAALAMATAGERWSRPGHQEARKIAALDGSVVIGGRFDQGLTVGSTEAVPTGRGIFLAVRPR